MRNCSFGQSEAYTLLFSAYAAMRESGYASPFVIDAADTDACVAAAFLSHVLSGMLCIKRKQKNILCHSLVFKEIA